MTPQPNRLREVLHNVLRDGLNARIEERHQTLLIWAVSDGYPEIALKLIASGARLNEHNSDGNTALLRAACEGRLQLAHALIEAGAKLNLQNNDGYSALILAKRRGNTAIAEALVKAGADVSLQTKMGTTVENPGHSPKTPLVGPRDHDLEQQIMEAIAKATATQA